MNLLLITDTFPPLKGSGAVQFRDLANEIVCQGHSLTVIVPRNDIPGSYIFTQVNGVNVYQLKSPPIKDVGLIKRTLNELLLPLLMYRGMIRSGLSLSKWDAVVWHSPSIFFGPLVSLLKKKNKCSAYLIIRDIFPDWAVDLGLIKRCGLIHYFFSLIARYQYSVADTIGVQSSGNKIYFKSWVDRYERKLEVLPNWLGRPGAAHCYIQVQKTALAGRKLLVYAGNMGVAQGMDIILDLAEKLRDRKDIGFLMVGRGSDSPRLKYSIQDRQLDNILFFDEIEPEEIPSLYAQCHIGIVALDHRHKSHNIPGKFLTYMQSGLPVLANVNKGNDLAEMIRRERVGEVCETNEIGDLLSLAEKLLCDIQSNENLPARCKALFESNFAVANTVKQIMASVS